MTDVVHGGLSEDERSRYAARGIDVVDLSASLNPYGPHPRVLRAARRAAVERYPEVDAATLRRAYADVAGLPAESVLAGNGSSELIYLLARAFLRSGATALIAGPTFGEYRAAACAADADVVECTAAEPDFAPDVATLVREIDRLHPALTFVCNPNNPTGALLEREAMDALAAAARAAGGRLIVDEAYMDFVDGDWHLGPAEGRLILRTLTKMHAIPGLRVGFLLGTPEDIAAVGRLQPPWSVAAPAAAAALQALQERRFVESSRRRVAAACDALYAGLAHRGLRVLPPSANFLLVDAGDGAAARTRLLERGFAVRDCASFGLPRYVRVAVPRVEQVDALVAALAESTG